MSINPYEILGVDETASLDEIKAAYKKLLDNNPDSTDQAWFNKVNWAYDLISDPEFYQTHHVGRLKKISDTVNMASEKANAEFYHKLRMSMILSKIKLYFAVIFPILCLWFGFTPYLTVHNMRKAAEAKDAAELSTYVDFPALKESLKGNFNALMAKEMAKNSTGNKFDALGSAFKAVITDRLADSLVTPESIALMMNAQKPLNGKSEKQHPPANESEIDTTMSYEGFNSFLVSVKNKNSSDVPVGFVFSRNGIISWKLTSLHGPIIDEQLHTLVDDIKAGTPVK